MDQAPRCPDFARLLRESPPDASINDQVAQCFQGELARIAAARCRDDSIAEDAAQEALLTALQSLGSYRGDAPIDHWLKRLVVSSCSRLRRGRKNSPAFNLPLDAARAEAVDADQEVAVLLRQRVELLEEALGDLDDENRELLLLHEGQECSLKTLAEQYDLSVDSVKGRLKRARARLRERLLELAEHPA